MDSWGAAASTDTYFSIDSYTHILFISDLQLQRVYYKKWFKFLVTDRLFSVLLVRAFFYAAASGAFIIQLYQPKRSHRVFQHLDRSKFCNFTIKSPSYMQFLIINIYLQVAHFVLLFLCFLVLGVVVVWVARRTNRLQWKRNRKRWAAVKRQRWPAALGGSVGLCCRQKGVKSPEPQRALTADNALLRTADPDKTLTFTHSLNYSLLIKI